MNKQKIEFYKPKTIKEAIDNLQGFLEADLYSKFKPIEKLPTGKNKKMEKWIRKDFFKNEKEFIQYLEDHFNILRKQIKECKKWKP